MTRRCLWLLVLGASVLPLAPAQEAKPAATSAPATTLRIGSWNIEWLGNAKRRQKPAQDPDDLARYIAASGVSLLGLNEITCTSGTGEPPTNQTLTEVCERLNQKPGGDWRHLLFAKLNGATDKDQWTGILWNQSVARHVDGPWKVPVRRTTTTADIWQRTPWAMKFSSAPQKTDIVVVPVHMKSNVGGIEKTTKQRADEARALVRSLGELQNRFTDDDIVVLGDMNCRKNAEPAVEHFKWGGLRDLNALDQPTWIKSKRFPAVPFDRILVPEDQPEFAQSKQVVFKEHHLENEAAFRAKMSDHYMVTADVSIMDDDD